MLDPAPYDVIVSRAGHDRGKHFMVVGVREDGKLLLCDGKNRRLAAPKGKSPKHVRLAMTGFQKPAGDREIRRTIALAASNAAAKEEMLLGQR